MENIIEFYNGYEGSEGLKCFEIKINEEITLTVINIYAVNDKNKYTTTSMHHILFDLNPILTDKDRSIILGGDLNVSRQYDTHKNYINADGSNKFPLHKLVFDLSRL